MLFYNRQEPILSYITFIMNTDKILESTLDISTEWQDVQIVYKNKLKKDVLVDIPLILTGSNGIYVFLNEEKSKEDMPKIFSGLQNELKAKAQCLYIFLFGEEYENEDGMMLCKGSYYDNKTEDFYILEDIYESFENFYYNHFIPQADLDMYNFKETEDYFELNRSFDKVEEDSTRYIRPVVESFGLERCEKQLEKILSEGKRIGHYTYHPDGSITIYRHVTSNKPWASYVDHGAYDYPTMDEPGDTTLSRIIFGNWFGLQKFKEGKIKQGLFYFLTLGGWGFFYIIDVIAATTGAYFTVDRHYFKNDRGKIERKNSKIFIQPVTKKMKALFAIPILAVLLLTVKFAYIPALSYTSSVVSEKISETISSYILNKEFQDGNMTKEKFQEMVRLAQEGEAASHETGDKTN